MCLSWPGWVSRLRSGETTVKSMKCSAAIVALNPYGQFALDHRLSRGRRDATVRTGCAASDSLGRESSHPRVARSR